MSLQKFAGVIWAVSALFFAGIASASQPNDCTLSFTGSYRKAVKLRSANLAYQKYNGGKPISLNKWFQLTKT